MTSRLPRVRFVSPSKAFSILLRQSDYFGRFCPADWKARGVHGLAEYLLHIRENGFGTFTPTQARKLVHCIHRVCERWMTHPPTVDWFDGKKAVRMGWKVAAVTSDAYENGLPHTHQDVIFLPVDVVDSYSTRDLCRLLKHEQTHIYQRKYPRDVRRFLHQYGFRRWKRHTRRENVRANPDTDGWLYERRGERFAFPYAPLGEVRSLHSVCRHRGRSHPRYEHPFEWMAYLLERL